MWRIETAFDATPWALPVFGAGVPLVITLTPTQTILNLGTGAAGERFCHAWPPPSTSALFSTHEDWLNVVMLVPLGVAAAWLPSARQRYIGVLAALALPPAIEATQYLATPWLGRSCQIDDVIQNRIGVAVGVAFGSLVRWQWSLLRRG